MDIVVDIAKTTGVMGNRVQLHLLANLVMVCWNEIEERRLRISFSIVVGTVQAVPVSGTVSDVCLEGQL